MKELEFSYNAEGNAKQHLPFSKIGSFFKKKKFFSVFPLEIILSVLEFHLNETAPYEPFCIKLLSLITVPLKFICIVVYVSGSFLFTAEQYSVV